MENPYVSLQDAAAYTGLSTKTLRKYIAEGDLPAYRRRGRAIALIRVRVKDLDALFLRIPNATTTRRSQIRDGRSGPL